MSEENLNYDDMAEAAFKGLQENYCDSKGIYYTEKKCMGNQYWWNSAIGLESVMNHMVQTRKIDCGYIKNAYDKAKVIDSPPFINDYYDDNGWWAISWIKAYDLCKKDDPDMAKQYLSTADDIFMEMTTGWTDSKSECGGGIWWKKIDPPPSFPPYGVYKAAIQNELFLVVAARLHQRLSTDPHKSDYLDWANREWNWFKDSTMIDQDNLVKNGPNDSPDCSCVPYCELNDVKWTYNQGVILGGLVELYKITGENDLLEQAQATASAAITYLCDEKGVLQEPCELNDTCDSDSECFKGIFIRYLSFLYNNLPESNPDRKKYADFIKLNAASIWENDRQVDEEDKTFRFGTRWSGGSPNAFNVCTQISAFDAFNAAVSVVK